VSHFFSAFTYRILHYRPTSSSSYDPRSLGQGEDPEEGRERGLRKTLLAGFERGVEELQAPSRPRGILERRAMEDQVGASGWRRLGPQRLVKTFTNIT
jgi:hypothetical protein